MTYCSKCGKPLQQSDANFCTSCGVRLAPAPAYAPPPPAYAPPVYTPPPPAPAPPMAADRATFRNTGLGFVLIGILLVAALGLAFFSPMFFSIGNLENLFWSFVTYAIIGFAAVLSSRAKGPDLSVGYVAGLTSVIVALNAADSGSLLTGLVIALVVGAAVGFVNGVCSVYLRISAVIVTLITGFFAYFTGMLISQGYPITPGFSRDNITGIAFLLLIVTFAVAFLLVLFTRLGQPSFKRDKEARLISFIFAYVGSAVIAVLAGLFLTLRLGVGMPTIGTHKELPILFIFAVVYSSRALDNRIAPVLFSLVPAWVWALLSNGLALLSVDVYTQNLITAAITLVFMVLARVCRFERRRAPSLD